MILASGRPVKSMLKLADKLGLHEHRGVILSNNGSIGYDTKNHKIIFDTPIEKDYKAMSEMIYGEYPSFEEIIKVLQELEKEINK